MTLVFRPDGAALDVGPGKPTRVNALIGASHRRNVSDQLRKLEALRATAAPCQIVSDLSIVQNNPSIWKAILDFGYFAATLPIYTVEPRQQGIDELELLDRVREQAEGGVGIITIHPTPTQEIITQAQSRLVPFTSRGGGIVIKDLAVSRRRENVYVRILPDIIAICLKYKTTISLGASFRSANIFDSADAAQMSEIRLQLELAQQIKREGVGVIIESPGHARPSSIALIADALSSSGVPIMPLGPIPTDVAVGQDHVSSAIGATLMGLKGAAHILAAVTREEHTGNIPTIPSTIEAVRAAAIAAHVIDIEMLGAIDEDLAITERRAATRTCVDGKVSKGCNRCAAKCPLYAV
ncbi:phosphomethylpyrimidine synthase ThiC [Rhizobium paknamense]|uniref:Phosphomethylpyrimidine synthase n=1 Tax=Rhizobium paknamense TaxID=1206817 RepID=A0ABU0I9H4_9HYPH|nr:phosphomethylpyrimidine synthase ThiC [Rhizobium paknamense]MDQ0454890.1 phosphomethylpyrimidine synthase [Rhizobium paknamense]